MSIKLSTSGIRGKYDELTPNRVVEFGQIFASYMGGGDVIVGFDGRPSGKFITEAVISGLRSSGSNVCNYGNLPSPVLQWIIKQFGFSGGVSITAGHNPFEWNSLIFFNRFGSYLNHLEGEEFFNLYHSGNIVRRPFNRLGKYSEKRTYLNDYFMAHKLDCQSKCRLKFVVDCSNGFNGQIIESLSKSLKTNLIPIFSSKENHLQRDPEPNIKNACILSTVVKETGSDGGFFLNSDASRVLVVDENGNALSEELTLPFFSRMVLEKERSDIITNYSTSRLVDKVAAQFGVKVFRTDVGQPYVVQMVKEIKARLGGEGSGSIVYSPFSFGFDAFVFIREIVAYLRRTNRTISSFAAEFDSPDIFKETISLPPHKIYDLLDKIGDLYHKKKKLKDGFFISDGDDWLCVRASSTVSMIRIIGEGENVVNEMKRIKDKIG